jgi:virulence factor Mce-like protein
VRSVAGPSIKLAVFATVTVLLTGVLAATIANTEFGTTSTYTAVFTDASGLAEGDDVRIRGVKVGRVASLEVLDDSLAAVDIEIEADRGLPATVTATVKYRNIIGQRYVALGETEAGRAPLFEPGGTIPVDRTRPALDLTALFNGFQPLFRALTPEDVNRLSFEIIQVFQGEGGIVESLLSHVASLTDSLADKDAVIGSVIDNLNTVMGSIAARDQQLSGLIVSLQQFVTGLAGDRDAIFDSLQTIDTLATTTSGFLKDARPPLAADIQALGDLSANLADTGDVIEGFLQLAPMKIDLITRTAINGSWFNFFMCGASGYVVLPVTDANGNEVGVTQPAGDGLATGERGCQ